MNCPVCDLPNEVPPTSARCACGYDLKSGDRSAAAALAIQARARGIRIATRGMGVLALLPFTVIVGVVIPGMHAGVIAMLPFQVAFGLALMFRGWRVERGARLRLLRASQPIPLPVARVIE